jgi:DNA polymerase-3 subunit chi
MTRIHFYLLPDASTEARDYYACQMTEEAFRLGRRVLIHTGDEAHSLRLDALLWRFRDSSFIPHSIQGCSDAQASPAVEIGHGSDAGAQHDLLINLATAVPAFFSRFEQVNEIVVEQEQAKEQSRERYRFYLDRGYPLEHHRIRQRILSQ